MDLSCVVPHTDLHVCNLILLPLVFLHLAFLQFFPCLDIGIIVTLAEKQQKYLVKITSFTNKTCILSDELTYKSQKCKFPVTPHNLVLHFSLICEKFISL